MESSSKKTNIFGARVQAHNSSTMAASETWDNHRKLTLDDQLYSQLIPKLKYTFIIHKSVDKCPMLVDIYFACLQNTPKGSRKSNCKYHHDILQDCLMTELKLEYVVCDSLCCVSCAEIHTKCFLCSGLEVWRDLPIMSASSHTRNTSTR